MSFLVRTDGWGVRADSTFLYSCADSTFVALTWLISLRVRPSKPNSSLIQFTDRIPNPSPWRPMNRRNYRIDLGHIYYSLGIIITMYLMALLPVADCHPLVYPWRNWSLCVERRGPHQQTAVENVPNCRSLSRRRTSIRRWEATRKERRTEGRRRRGKRSRRQDPSMASSPSIASSRRIWSPRSSRFRSSSPPYWLVADDSWMRHRYGKARYLWICPRRS